MTPMYQSLKELLAVCQIHIDRIDYALSRVENFLPMTPEKLTTMSKDHYAFLDSVVGRFEKLQDAIGEKIFPRILKLEEEFKLSESFIDRLGRLEKLEVIQSADKWIELRQLRNELSHEYAQMEPKELSDSINKIVASCGSLKLIFSQVFDYIKERGFIKG